MKTCNICSKDKPLSEFHSKSALCKPCKTMRDFGRSRNGNPKRERTPSARRRKSKWLHANADTAKEAARRAVRSAVESGSLVPAENCSACGIYVYRSDGRRGIQAHHHHGYGKPLDVQWLCPKCHRKADDAARTPKETSQ